MEKRKSVFPAICIRVIEFLLSFAVSSVLLYLPIVERDIGEWSAAAYFGYFLLETVLFYLINFFSMRAQYRRTQSKANLLAVNLILLAVGAAACTALLFSAPEETYTMVFGFTEPLRAFAFRRGYAALFVWLMYLLEILFVTVTAGLDFGGPLLFHRIFESVFIIGIASCLMYLPIQYEVVTSLPMLGYFVYFFIEAMIFYVMNFFSMTAYMGAVESVKSFLAANFAIMGVQGLCSLFVLELFTGKTFTIFFGFTKPLRAFRIQPWISSAAFWLIYALIILYVAFDYFCFRDASIREMDEEAEARAELEAEKEESEQMQEPERSAEEL